PLFTVAPRVDVRTFPIARVALGAVGLRDRLASFVVAVGFPKVIELVGERHRRRYHRRTERESGCDHDLHLPHESLPWLCRIATGHEPVDRWAFQRSSASRAASAGWPLSVAANNSRTATTAARWAGSSASMSSSKRFCFFLLRTSTI